MNDEKIICTQTGKKCYETRRDAERTIRYFRNTNYNGGRRGKNIPARAYLCDFCNEWHLTHYKGKNRPIKKNVKRY